MRKLFNGRNTFSSSEINTIKNNILQEITRFTGNSLNIRNHQIYNNRSQLETQTKLIIPLIIVPYTYIMMEGLIWIKEKQRNQYQTYIKRHIKTAKCL